MLHKKIVFIVLRDESNIIQCVISKQKNPELFEEAEKLTIESSIKVSGELKKDERAPTGYEIAVSDLDDHGAMTRHFRRLAGGSERTNLSSAVHAI